MIAPSSGELLSELEQMGAVSLSHLVMRLTGSVRQLFDSFGQLREAGLIEVDGNAEAVEEFITHAQELEGEHLDREEELDRLFAALKAKPEAAEAGVHLTKHGFLRALRM